MSKFMQIAGIVAAAAGIAISLMAFFSPGQMQIYGLTAETGSVLLVGGLLMIGVGGAIIAIEASTRATLELRDWLAGHEAPGQMDFEPAEAMAPAVAVAAAVAVAEAEQSTVPERDVASNELRIRAEAGAAEKTEEAVEGAKTSTEETLASLDKATADIAAALDLEPKEEQPAEPVAEPEAEPEAESETEAELEPEAGEGDDQLYVVEEKLIRGRPARVLSDGTVEAETDEGWMRFENLEHLEEYLDAMSPVKV